MRIGDNLLLLDQLPEWRSDNLSVLGLMVTLFLEAKALTGVIRLLSRRLFLLQRMSSWAARRRFRSYFAAFLGVSWFARRTENTTFDRLLLHWVHELWTHHCGCIGWTRWLDLCATHLRLWSGHHPSAYSFLTNNIWRKVFWWRSFSLQKLFRQLLCQIMIRYCHLSNLSFPLL